jgi:hypothetical protein
MNLHPNDQLLALHALLRVALPVVEGLPVTERADAYEGIAVACRGLDREAGDAAMTAANSLRESMSAQLLLQNIIK